jgi:hypothetical protein
MTMKNILFFGVALTLVLASCKSAFVTNNYATTTENIFNLTAGMSLDDVSKTLKSEPTDIYSNIVENQKIVVYKYRKNYQLVPVKKKDHVDYLRGEKRIYKDESNLYVVIDSRSNKLLYFITDSGRKAGNSELNQALKVKLKN